jgi:uncharacterized caspase-like protein
MVMILSIAGQSFASIGAMLRISQKEISCGADYFNIIAIALLVFSTNILLPSEAQCGRKALLIGNGKYQYAALRNPENDAGDLSNVLKDLGFQVETIINGNKNEMKNAIHSFARRISRDDVAFFFYAGHAVQMNNENYLLPVGDSAEEGAVKLTDVINALKNSDISIVVLDACRNNPKEEYYQIENGILARSSRGIGRVPKTGLAPPKRSMESFVAYSTDVGNVAEDGSGRNSTFTKYLLRRIKTPGVRLEAVFKKVREDVANETNGRQIPWESSSITGDFYFVK